MVRDLGLPKDKSELLGSRLKERNLLAPGTTFCWYRDREKSLVGFFSEGGNYVFCNDVSGFMQKLGLLYDTAHWRLFIDSSKRSLKAVLLHNSNKYASISIAHSVYLNESYENVQTILEAIEYEQHKWQVCEDLKVTRALYVCGIAEIELSIMLKRFGLFVKLSKQETPTFSKNL